MPSFQPTAVGLAVLLALSGCSPAADTEDLLGRARQALEAGDLASAGIDVKSVLQRDAASAEARRLHGEIYLLQHQPAVAATEFERSLKAGADPAVAALYAEALVTSGQSPRLIEAYEGGDLDFAAGNPDFLAHLASAQALVGDTFAAEETLASARERLPESPAMLFAEALFHLRHAGDLDAAMAVLETLTQRYPDHHNGWSLLGSAALVQGDIAQAEQAFERAVQLNSHRLNDRLLLSNLLLDRGEREAAAAMLQPVLDSVGGQPGVLYVRARLLLTENRPQAALEVLQRLLTVMPEHQPGLYLAGLSNLQAGNLATADLHLAQFLSTQPLHVNARLLQGRIHLQLGERERARTVARRILEEQPDNPLARQLLADSAETAPAETAGGAGQEPGPADEASDHAASPGELVDLLRQAASQAQAGEVSAMVDSLQQALQRYPGAVEPRLVLARYHVQQQQHDQALSLLNELPEHPRVLLAMGRIEQARGNSGEAERLARRALAATPDDEDARKLLTAALLGQGRLEEAVEWLESWLESVPDDIPTLHRVAAYHLQQGREDKAQVLYERLVKLSPEDVVALNNLAWLERSSRPDRALELVDRALELAPGQEELLDTRAAILSDRQP